MSARDFGTFVFVSVVVLLIHSFFFLDFITILPQFIYIFIVIQCGVLGVSGMHRYRERRRVIERGVRTDPIYIGLAPMIHPVFLG